MPKDDLNPCRRLESLVGLSTFVLLKLNGRHRACIRDSSLYYSVSVSISTKIWCYDHNFNNLGVPSAILGDPRVAGYVNGTAFHHYEGRPSAMATLSSRFPEKHLYFTEGSVFGVNGAAQIVEYLRNGARSYNAWVTIIDHKGQPNPGPHDCSPTCIVLNSDNLTLDYRFDYYMYGQFMRFIRPGAVRVHSDESSASLPNCAVHHPDGSLVLVVVNRKSRPARFDVEWDRRHITSEIPGASVATYRWQPSAEYIPVSDSAHRR